jgi:WD40 repeat protein
VTQVRISRGGDLAVGRDSGPVDLYRSREGEYIRLALSDRDASFLRHEVTSLSFSPDGKTLLAGRDTGSIASWSLLSDGRSIIDQPTKREVVDMAFSDDGTLFAAASRDRSIQIGFIRQEAAGPAFQPSTILDLHRDSVHALAFDGSAVLATGGGDGTVKLWSLERGKLAAAVGK